MRWPWRTKPTRPQRTFIRARRITLSAEVVSHRVVGDLLGDGVVVIGLRLGGGGRSVVVEVGGSEVDAEAYPVGMQLKAVLEEATP